MSATYDLVCARCGARPAPASGLCVCPACGGRLDVGYPDIGPALRRAFAKSPAGGAGIWRFGEVLPITAKTPRVTLGEGATPLQVAGRLRESVGVAELLLKNETLNPTGSFKDRSAAVAVAKAVEAGATAAALTSAGNAGAAAAAYSARAGLPLYVFAHRNVPRERLVQIGAYGARIVLTGEDSNDTVTLLDRARSRHGWHMVTTALAYNPYQAEGAKTIAYEVAELCRFDPPEWVVAPVGGGSLLSALAKGFRELSSAGLIGKLPRLVGVQSAGCAAVVRAYESGALAADIAPWGAPTTIAHSIADPVPLDGETALLAIRESGGVAVAVSDEEMLAAEESLAREEGVFAEPGSAATLAALCALRAQGVIPGSARVALVITGGGQKDLAAARRVARPPAEIACDDAALERHLAGERT